MAGGVVSALRVMVDGRPTWKPDTDPYLGLSQRTRYIIDRLRGHNGNRSRTARDIGVTVQTVQRAVRVAAAAGVRVPAAPKSGAGRGPDLLPRKGLRGPCAAPLARTGEPCARGIGHAGGHRSALSERLMRRTDATRRRTA